MSSSDAAPPRVSVVLPVYNGARWLSQAIESILAQSLADFGLLIIDDGSTDTTPQILDRFASFDPRVRTERQPHGGLCAALNRGLALARAPLLARLDADDVSAPTRLERQAAFLDAHSEVGLLGCWALEIDSHGRGRGERRPPVDPRTLAGLLARTNPMLHPSIMARTELMRAAGGYRPAFEAAEDYDLWLRMGEITSVANLPEVLISYRAHSESISARRALRMAFSARLARRAAAGRRDGAPDPAAALTAPPDWHDDACASAFYADDAALFRWMDRSADGAGARPCETEVPLDWLSNLSTPERRLAGRALLLQMTSTDTAMARAGRAFFFNLCRQRPGPALQVAWSLRR